MSQGVIELNGKRYDAITGAYLGKSHVVPKHIMLAHRTTDGFVRPSHQANKATPHKPMPVAPTMHDVAPHPMPTSSNARPLNTTKVHAAPKILKAHHPERAKTLMRRIVHKPEYSLKPAIKPQAPAEVMAKPSSALMRKRSAENVDPLRLQRAAMVNQHQAIRHFLPPNKPVVATHTAAHVPVIAVRPTPEHKLRTAQPARNEDIFEKALARATSHQQPKPKLHHSRRHRRLTNSLAVGAAFLIIGGFISYLNLPGIELRVASIQAGFNASMPTYTPTGYALHDGIKKNGGTVSFSFRSGDSQYTITQQSSNWNSQTLLDNTLALSGAHQTIQKNGQTIYIYGNGASAAWVSGGVRYDISGNAQLGADEITAIAASL